MRRMLLASASSIYKLVISAPTLQKSSVAFLCTVLNRQPVARVQEHDEIV